MSFGWTAATWAAIGATAAAVGTVSAIDGANNARSAQRIARQNAEKTQQEAARANNRANAKTPDAGAMLAANLLAGQAGQSGTLLTGPKGVDTSLLTLGKSSLLGG